MREIIGLALIGIGIVLVLPWARRRFGSSRNPFSPIIHHHVDPGT